MRRPWVVPCFVMIVFVKTTGAAEPTGDAAILPEGAALEEIWNEGEFTEGVAVARDGMVYFSDISRDQSPGTIFRFDPATGETHVHCAASGKSNGLMFDRAGKLIAACGANYGAQALCEILPDGTRRVIVDKFNGKRFNSPNDLVIHPNGWIYFSDPRYLGPEPVELDLMNVYLYNPEGATIARLKTGVTKPNGVILSPDGKTLYIAETDNRSLNVDDPPPEGTPLRMTLNAFPVKADGTVGERRVLVDFGQKLGVDGMTMDVEGNIYAAVRSADRFGIVVFSPEGKERAYIPTPDLPTNCCFGVGKTASVLYVTAGTGLYRIPLKIRGHHPAVAPLVQ